MMVDKLFSSNQLLFSERHAWKLPEPEVLLEPAALKNIQVDANELRRNTAGIEAFLNNGNISARVLQTIPGPLLTQYRVEFKALRGRGVTNPQRYIAERKQATRPNHPHINRVTVPVEGRPQAVLEILNETRARVSLRQVICSPAFQSSQAAFNLALGVDLAGQPRASGLESLPHLLVAGMTGSGKSVLLDGLVLSLLLRHSPDDLRLVMISNSLELLPYEGLPHLLGFLNGMENWVPGNLHIRPWTTQGKHIRPLLRRLETERDRRLELLSASGCDSLAAYNKRASEQNERLLPRIVIFHEHFFIYGDAQSQYDWSPEVPPLKEVDPIFTRLAQSAQAAGIHLVVTNTFPSRRDMSAGLRASFPAQACFGMANPGASRVALGLPGAEYLSSPGDYLFRPDPAATPERLLACDTSWDEAKAVVAFWKDQAGAHPEWSA